MGKRRARLLVEARALLASGGFETLNLRELARRAGVTVPTIYNLIGRKEDLFLAIAEEVLTELESRAAPGPTHDPVELAESFVRGATELFAEDESFFRAAFLAVEWLDQSGQHHAAVERLYAWVDRLFDEGIQACVAAGHLRGAVPAAALSAALTRALRMACRGWAFGHYDLATLRRITANDLRLALCADAVDTFRQRLQREITLTENETPPAGSTRMKKQAMR